MNNNSEFKLWLVIGILIALFIWQMPNIERLMFGRAKKEKISTEEKKEEEQVIMKSGRVTCGSTLTDNTTIEFLVNYENSEVKKAKTITKTIYTEKNDQYNSDINICNNIKDKYKNQTGFQASCVASDTLIETTYNFDLKTFKTFTIENDGATETISLDIKYNDNIDDVVKYYEREGATCK